MEFTQVLSLRKSLRDYSTKPVEPEKITKILESAILSPSWANKQCTKYIVVTEKSKIRELCGMINSWLKNAPVVIVACADPKDSGSRNGMDYYLLDVGISMQQLILAATDLGLCTCWIGGFNETKAKKTLEVPDKIKVVAMTPVGYSKEKRVLQQKLPRRLLEVTKGKLLSKLFIKKNGKNL